MSSASQETSAPPNLGASAPARVLSVLIIEDDAVSQKIMEKICHGLGHSTVVVPSTIAAREALQRKVFFDLVFLDSQLGPEWGWVLLGELRGDPLYRTLPVVVYTGHTERGSLLQYIDLGVQAVRAKPIKAEVVAGEIDKAAASNWPGRMAHSSEEVCRRLRITQTEYYSTLATAVTEMERGSQELKGLLGQRTSPKLTDSIKSLRTKAGEIGLPAMEIVLDAMQAAVDRRDLPFAVRCVQRVDQLVAYTHRRCADHFNVEATPLITRLPTERAPDLPAAQPPPPAPLSSSGAALLGRKIAAAPAWTLGKCFGRLKSVSLFSKDDQARMADEALRTNPMSGFLDVVRRVEAIPGAGLDSAQDTLRKMPGFTAPFYRILEQRGLISDKEDRERALERLGYEPSLILCEAARSCSCALVDSPLSLSHAMVHSVTTGLVAYEMGRYLHLANAHLLYSLGLLHDVGRWVMMIMEPGFYSVVVGMAQGEGTDLSVAERMVFGTSQDELGERVVSSAGLRELYAQCIRHLATPGSPLVAPENAVSLAIVHLASEMTHAAAAEDKRHASEIIERISLDQHPCWSVLHQHKVPLQLGPRETVHRFMRVAASCHWASMVLGNWAVSNRLAR